MVREYRRARAMIGLMPQELTTNAFETVWAKVRFSRGPVRQNRQSAHIEKVLRSLSLWDKKGGRIMTLRAA